MALVEVIYFDLGDTLGVPVFSPDRRLVRFDAFGFSRQVLERLASWHLRQEPPARPLRLGVISYTGNEPAERVNQILDAAGLLEHFDRNLLVYKKKDSSLAFREAADAAGLSGGEDRCLFVGEDAIERGFAMDAGFRVCPHPLLAEEVLSGQALFYLRLRGPSSASRQQWQNLLNDLPVVPIHASGAESGVLYLIASKRTISKLVDMKFQGTPLGEPNAPLRTEAYLLHRDPAPGADDDMSGTAATLCIAERFISLSAGRTLARTVRFVAFNAEEDGRVGSQAYARQLRALGTRVAGVFQMDMIGTNKTAPHTWEIHVGCRVSAEAEARSLPLAELVAAVAREVSSGLEPAQICPTPDDADERSDHASFQVLGYGACCVSEDLFIGPGANAPPPDGSSHYHQSSDKAEHIDADYAAMIAGAVGAAAWKLATLTDN